MMKKKEPAEAIVEIILDKLNNDDTIYFIPNPGNAGDALINATNYRILRKAGINVKVVNPENLTNDLKGKTVIYGPAGGLIEAYAESRRIVEYCIAIAKRIILLPCTIRNNEDLLKRFDNRVTVMCRDNITYNYLKQVTHKSTSVIESEDSALNCDANFILANPPSTARYIINQLKISKYHARIALIQMIKWQYLYATRRLQAIFGYRNVNIFRNDAERVHSPPTDNVDISAYLENNDMSELGSGVTTYRFLKFINLYTTINTNRLHAAIGALMLGKFVNFYDNSYGKNHAIYVHSLKRRFPNKIAWHAKDIYS